MVPDFSEADNKAHHTHSEGLTYILTNSAHTNTLPTHTHTHTILYFSTSSTSLVTPLSTREVESEQGGFVAFYTQ